MNVQDSIRKIIGGSSFMCWASLNQSDDDIINMIPNNDIIKKQIKNLHMYEVRGIADKKEDTLHMIGEVFIGHIRVFESFISISDIQENPETFCDMLEKAMLLCTKYLTDHYSSFLSSKYSSLLSIDPSMSQIDDLLDTHMYVYDVNDLANNDLNGNVDLSKDKNITIKKFEFKNADPKDGVTDNSVATMIFYIKDHIRKCLSINQLFVIEITYHTTNSIGDDFEATTILDSVEAFNDLVVMLGGFSFFGNSIIVMPKMEVYSDDPLDEYVNNIVCNNIYEVFNTIYKISNKPTMVSVKTGIKDENNKEEFWRYV